MDFDTSKNSRRDGRRSSGGGGTFVDTRRSGKTHEDFRIPAGAKKAALVHLALEAWRKGLLDPKQLGEVRGRDVDETGLQRALYRSSIGEIEHAIGPVLKDKRIIVEGRLAGTARSSLERLGAEVEELRLEDEKRYIDMTPAIFVLAAVFMAVRYISLGLDDQSLYILAGLGFALMYGLRPFFSKMQRPRDE
ncbi:MAG: hypothetical protein M3518_00220 [Actinomycetota bacterium]|nr:hypothetical protein [Actinomycetota bacterium]